MKKHTIFGKKLIAFITLLLCFVMAFSTVACGGTGSGNPGGNKPPVVNPPSGGEDEGGEGGGTENPPVTPPSGGTTKKVELSLKASSDGYGTRALELQGERFEKAFANKTYSDGKGNVYTGVEFTVESEQHSPSPTASWLQEPITMYNAATTYTSVQAAYANGYIANIDSILRTQIGKEGKTVLDKMDPSMLYAYTVDNPDSTNPDKKDVMGFPFAQTISGFMYDKDLFDGLDQDGGYTNPGYYVAAPDADEDVTYFDSYLLDGTQFEDFATVGFVNRYGKKSVGPNGIANDYDDGLPSSFLEFIVLCEYLKENGVAPFAYSGEYPTYLNLGIGAMLFSMLGYDNAKALMEFKSDAINVVTGFQDADLFSEALSGDMTIKVPNVATIKMEESSGYYTTWTLENYLCVALGELITAQDWDGYSADYGRSHLQTHYDFIFGIEPDKANQGGAMMPEGSYWYNEATDAGTFKSYANYYHKTPDQRGLAWMSLPVNVYASVTGENKTVTNFGVSESVLGEPQTLDDIGTGAFLVNARFKDDKAVMDAVADYILFVCSNAEMNRFAVDAGYIKNLEFVYDEDIMMDAPRYVQNTFKLFGDSNIVTMFAESKTWRERADYTFTRSYDSDYLKPSNLLNYNGGLPAFVANYGGAVGAFQHNVLSYDEWWQYYKGPGEHTPPTYGKYPEGHPLEGENVVFTEYKNK